MGLDENPSKGHVVSYKNLGDEEFHTFLGMAGDCMKDNGKGRFELCITMSLDVMIKKKLTYIKFDMVGFKYHVNLAHSDI